MSDILALDLGTKTGYAYCRAGVFEAGTWVLATPKEITAWGKQRITRRNDPRIERLCEKLTALGKFDIVIFEDVTFSTTTYQTQLWSALRAALWLCADGALFECLPVSTLKKFATGSGSADKEAMAAALMHEFPFMFDLTYDDNAIDACWLWQYARKNLTRIIP
jgi:hypothetical protein